MKSSTIPLTPSEREERKARKALDRQAKHTARQAHSSKQAHKNLTMKAAHVRGGHGYH
jgi:hypothetical protein